MPGSVRYVVMRDGIAWGPFDKKSDAREFVKAHEEEMKGARTVTLLPPDLMEK